MGSIDNRCSTAGGAERPAARAAGQGRRRGRAGEKLHAYGTEKKKKKKKKKKEKKKRKEEKTGRGDEDGILSLFRGERREKKRRREKEQRKR